MVKSMTGYGIAKGQVGNLVVTVEIRSLNSKFLEMSLRLPGAYRDKELELRSDLGKQLDRGKRLMEIIKQGIQVPLPVVKQVAIIYAGVNGFLDDVPVNQIKAFEEYLHLQLDSKYAGFVELFNKTLAMTDEVKAALNNLLKEVKATFKA